MPTSRSTLFFLAALAVLGPVAITQPAYALQAMGPPPVRRADHIQLAHKLVKKRSPPPRLVRVRRQEPPADPAAETPPPGLGILDPPGTTTSISTSRASNISPTATSERTSTSVRTSSSTNPAVQSSTTSVSTTRSTSSTSSTSSSSTQQAALTSSTSTTSSTSAQDTSIQASSTQPAGRSTVLITTTSTPSSAPQESDKSKDEGASFLPKGAIVALIVAASCVVGAAAVWTIIRKWKFGASRKFEDRLEPINWDPPVTTGLPMDERDPAAVAIARANSQRSSFGSSDAGVGGVGGGRNMAAAAPGDLPVSVAPDFPPAHDFTAGPAHLAPAHGYADLQRGPSPTPSMNYGAYGQQYSAPNPYDAYDYNGGYGPYGGVQQASHNHGPGPHQF